MMSFLRRLYERKGRAGGASCEGDLDDELEFHLEMEREKLEREGVAPAEARRMARLALGGYDRIVEETREAGGLTALENAWRDIRLAFRGLRRSPGFSVVAILTLGIGTGATTAVFSLANALLIRPVADVRAPDELVVVQLSAGPGLVTGISDANITDLAAASTAFSSIAGYVHGTMQARAAGGAPFEVAASVVQARFFEVLGLEPLQGRWFTAEESDPRAAGDVIVISDRFRRERFGDEAHVTGRTVHLNANVYTIVGVAPDGFHGTEHGSTADVWLPVGAYARMWHRPVEAWQRESSIFYELVGRLAPGATAAQAEHQLRGAMAALVDRFPDVNAQYEEYLPTVHAGLGLPVSERDATRRTMALLLGVVAVLLLIACANVANLLLSRGIARQAELAMRRALGATRARLLQQQLAEGAVLSLAGAVLGVGVAVLFGELFRTGSVAGLPVLEEFTIDGRVIAFALCAALGTSLFFTLIPALAGRRARSGLALRAGGRSAGDAGAGLRSALTVVQVAASLALLVGALMLVQTVRNLHGIERGYEPDAVLAYGFTPSPQGYGSQAARTLRRRLLEEVALLPGIRSASVASALPVPDDRFMSRLSVPGREADPLVVATFDVSAAYFTTLGTRIVAGRAFTPAEQHQPLSETPGVILSAAAARELFGTADPLNRVVEIRGFTGTTLQPVLGIAEDVRMAARDEVMPVMYQPLGAAALPHGYLLVQSNLGPAQTQQMVTGALARLDPAIPLFQSESLADALRHAIAAERLLAVALGLFAALAVTLAAIGLYGVIAYSVARRRSEIGIRMAIGAPRLAIVRLIAMRSFRLLGIGVLAGSVAAYALGRLLESRIYGVSPVEPSLYLAAIVFFVAVTALASALPARAATRIDPARALRPQ